jgi:hypothetical protein
MDWINPAQYTDKGHALVNMMIISHQGSLNVDNFLTTSGTICFLQRTLLHGVGWLVGRLVGLFVS